MKIFMLKMLKMLKQRSILNLFSNLAYKRIKIKLLKSVTYWQSSLLFEPKCSNCVKHTHNSLYIGTQIGVLH